MTPGERPAAQAVVGGLAGVLFAIGLAMSGMTQRGRVIGFLDPLGGWDATLAFVMAEAIAVHAPIYWLLIRRRRRPAFAPEFSLPVRRDIDGRLLLGAALFGIGWGLVGFCPGPALVALATLTPTALVFVAAMIAGMAAFHGVERFRAPGQARGDGARRGIRER